MGWGSVIHALSNYVFSVFSRGSIFKAKSNSIPFKIQTYISHLIIRVLLRLYGLKIRKHLSAWSCRVHWRHENLMKFVQWQCWRIQWQEQGLCEWVEEIDINEKRKHKMRIWEQGKQPGLWGGCQQKALFVGGSPCSVAGLTVLHYH